MQSLHVKANEQVITRILDFLNGLSKKGAQIEIVDDKVLAYERRMIDRSLSDIQNGHTYSLEEVESELLNAD